jgi:molybdate transport system substrate-binding protein
MFLFLFIPLSIPALAEVVTISAAATMTDAFKKLAETFKPVHPDITIQLNFGASGALAKQITQGAPVDIFMSGNTEWMDYLAKEQKIDDSSVRVLARNSLVFVGGQDKAVNSLADLERLDRIALGSPKSVTSGQYAEQAMRAAGVYDTLLSRNKFIMAQDVRQALLYADRGEADGAFVYRTDALLTEKAVILFVVPPELHTRIDYPLALTRSGKDKAAARIVYQYLNSQEALKILESFGFLGPDQAVTSAH